MDQSGYETYSLRIKDLTAPANSNTVLLPDIVDDIRYHLLSYLIITTPQLILLVDIACDDTRHPIDLSCYVLYQPSD